MINVENTERQAREMEERKLQLRQAKKVSIQKKREVLRPWRALSIVFLALSFVITPLTVFGEVFQITPPALFGSWVQEDGEGTEQLSYTAQAEAVTLLRNNGVLPLQAGAKVSATGWLQRALETAGCSVNTAENTDAVIVTVDAHTEAAVQKEQLIAAMRMKDEGKTQSIVLLVNADSPVLEDIFYKNADAALWIAGADRIGMQAVADVLTGKVNPSGRLPMTCVAQPVLYGGETSASQGADLSYKEYEAQYAAYAEGTETSDTYSYAEQVAFAFGFGLGYTEFTYSDMQVSPEGEQLRITLNVTNTGAVAGKETVQIYTQQPDKTGVSLAGFAKTQLLEAGETGQVTVTVDMQALSVYDAADTGANVLAAGDYYLTAAANAHQAVNNILAAKDYTPENTDGRMDGAGQRENVCLWTAEETRMFAAAAPVAQESQLPTMGAENGLRLAEMAGIAYDDPLWQTLLDQLDFPQMLDCYLRLPVAAVQAPAIRMAVLEKLSPSKTVLAASWNTQLIQEIGTGIGSSCLQKGITCLQDGLWQAEDTLLSGNSRNALYSGLQEKGIGICGDESIDAQRLLQSILSWPEVDSALINTLREICHRNLYRIANSPAMNSVDTQMWNPGNFWIMRGAMLLSWALFSVFVLGWISSRGRWKRTEEYLSYKTLKTTAREEKNQPATVV